MFLFLLHCVAENTETYHVKVKEACDTVQDILRIEEDGSPARESKKIHGHFSVYTDADSIEIVRPDVPSIYEGWTTYYACDDGTCSGYMNTEDEPFFFVHREEAVYNGHDCFKYYNDSEMVIYVDKDDILWGMFYLEDSDQVWVNYTYPTTPHTPDMFVFPEGTGCSVFTKAFEAPNETFFYDMCTNGSARLLSSLFLTVVAAVVSMLLF